YPLMRRASCADQWERPPDTGAPASGSRRAINAANSPATSRASSSATRTPSASLAELRAVGPSSRSTSRPSATLTGVTPELSAERGPGFIARPHSGHPVAWFASLRSLHFCALSSPAPHVYEVYHVTSGDTV